MGITHAFVNPKADSADTTITRPSDWNADHLGNGIGVFNVMDYGAMLDGTTDDTAAWQAAITAAVLVGGMVIVPPDSLLVGSRITSTLVIEPAAGQDSQARCSFRMDGSFPGLVWDGSDDDPVIWSKGWKNSTIENVYIRVGGIGMSGTDGVIGWLIDDPAAGPSSSDLTFRNCVVELSGTNGIGWQGGGPTSTATDISYIQFENCVVTGRASPNENADGNTGWHTTHANVIDWYWFGGRGDYLDTLMSGVNSGGMFVYGLGATNNLVEYDIGTAGTWTIVGGRYETGKRFGFSALDNSGGRTYATVVTMIGVEIASYTPADGSLFEMINSGQLVLDNCHILQGGFAMAWSATMFDLGGGGTGFASLSVRNGVIEGAADPFYTVLDSTTWAVRIENVTKTNSSGTTVSHYLNRQGNGGRVNDRAAAAPVAGTWAVGDTFYSTAPAASGNIGWVCTTAGTPGTWKTFGAIAA